MPIYEFKCHDCGQEFEELCPLGSTSWSCPKCQSLNTLRKVSRFSARSMGDGGKKNIIGNKCGSCHSGNCNSCH